MKEAEGDDEDIWIDNKKNRKSFRQNLLFFWHNLVAANQPATLIPQRWSALRFTLPISSRMCQVCRRHSICMWFTTGKTNQYLQPQPLPSPPLKRSTNKIHKTRSLKFFSTRFHTVQNQINAPKDYFRKQFCVFYVNHFFRSACCIVFSLLFAAGPCFFETATEAQEWSVCFGISKTPRVNKTIQIVFKLFRKMHVPFPLSVLTTTQSTRCAIRLNTVFVNKSE